MNSVYRVEGMTCNHCKAAIERVVMQVKNIETATAIPAENKLIISGNALEEDIRKAVEMLGYKFMGVYA